MIAGRNVNFHDAFSFDSQWRLFDYQSLLPTQENKNIYAKFTPISDFTSNNFLELKFKFLINHLPETICTLSLGFSIRHW
jgi:hypothetical protein